VSYLHVERSSIRETQRLDTVYLESQITSDQQNISPVISSNFQLLYWINLCPMQTFAGPGLSITPRWRPNLSSQDLEKLAIEMQNPSAAVKIVRE